MVAVIDIVPVTWATCAISNRLWRTSASEAAFTRIALESPHTEAANRSRTRCEIRAASASSTHRTMSPLASRAIQPRMLSVLERPHTSANEIGATRSSSHAGS